MSKYESGHAMQLPNQSNEEDDFQLFNCIWACIDMCVSY